MHEQGKMDSRIPPERFPWRRAGRHDAREHREEMPGIDRRAAVKRDGAAALEQQRPLRQPGDRPIESFARPIGADFACHERRSRAAGVACGTCDVVDNRPAHVAVAQVIGLSRPRAGAHGRNQRGAVVRRELAGPGRRDDREHAARIVPFGVGIVRVAIEADQRRDLVVRPVRQHHGAAAGDCRRHRQRGHGVAEVVLAVAERALAVLPRLAPVDRGQHHEPGVRFGNSAAPLPRIDAAALVERVSIGGVVIHARRWNSRDRTADHVGFGRMQVAARRVHAQRPARSAKRLPG